MSTPSAPVISNAPLASPNTLEYWWYPPSNDGGSAIEDYYFTLTSQYGTLNCNVGGPGNYYKVTGLSNAETYFTTIAASNVNGLGAIASFREFQPGSPPPRGVSSLSAVAITVSTGAALVSWTPPVGYPPVPDATIFWYAIYGYTTANTLTPVVKYTAGGLTQSNYFIPSLDSNSNYYFTVRAVNCPGWSVPLSTNTIGWIPQFAPNMLGGLQLWFDAQDTTSLVLSGTNVTTWNDKSGNVYNATGVNSPQYTTSQFVSFNGTNQYFTLPNNALPSGNSAYSYFGIVNFTTGGRSNGVIGGGTYGTNNSVFALRSGLNNEIVTYWWNNNVNTANRFTINTINYINSMYDGTGNRTLMLSFSSISTFTGAGTRTQTTGNNTIGTTNTSEYMAGRIYELVTYSNQVTPFNRQKIEGYLAWKWGLQTQLPITHPFRFAAPMSNSVFAPPMLSSLQLWLDASDVSTLTGLSTVSVWADKSGNSNNVSQAVSSQRPVRYTTANGLTGLSFTTPASASGNDTGGQWFRGTFTTPITNNSLSIFAVASMNSGAQNFARVVSLSALSNNDYNAGAGGANIARGGTGNSLTMQANGSTGIGGAVTLATPFIADSIFDGSNQFAIINGSQVANTGISVNFNIARSGIGFVSYQGTVTTNERWDGTINEVLVYNRGLSTQDRQTVEGYLAWKWGLQGNLPTTHPYRYNNPSIVQFNYPSPTSYGGLQLWLDASQLTGLSNGGTLTTWTDRTSNAYVGTAVASPTYITNFLNGLPVVRFNGTSQYINFGNILNIGSNSGVATFAVVKFNNTGAGGIVGKTVATGCNARWALRRETNSSRFFVDVNTSSPEATYSDTATTTQLVEGVWNRQQVFIYQNGALLGSNTQASTSNLSNAAPLWVGAYPNATGSAPQAGLFMNGDVGEILVYMSNITPFIRQQIEGYLTWKWGLQASLPTSHPYFTAPPQQAYTSFDPLLLPNLQLWLDASDATTFTFSSGTNISQWRDKSGRSNNANLTSGTVRRSTDGGLTVVDTTATGYLTTAVASTYTDTLTICVMVLRTTSTAGQMAMAAGFPRVTYNFTSSTYTIQGGPSPSGSDDGGQLGGNSYNVNGSRNALATNTLNNYHILSFTFSRGIGTIGTTLSIGAYGNGSSQFFGYIAEIIVFNPNTNSGTPYTEQRQTVEGYLAWKWGLQGLLPVTHPYALINPGNPAAAPTVTTSGLLIRFDASTYSGSGQWINTGSLGTSYNATITAGQTPAKNTAGNGIVLNGSCGWTFSHIGLQTSYTLSSWFKLTAIMGSDYVAYVTDSTDSGGTASINMALSGRNSGISVGTQGFAGGSYTNPTWRIGNVTNLNLNEWYMLSVSFDNTSKNLVTYINGINVNTATFTGFTPATVGLIYRIGQQITGTAAFITGEVGQVLIYNRALTATEVLQNYAATNTTFSV